MEFWVGNTDKFVYLHPPNLNNFKKNSHKTSTIFSQLNVTVDPLLCLLEHDIYIEKILVSFPASQKTIGSHCSGFIHSAWQSVFS